MHVIQFASGVSPDPPSIIRYLQLQSIPSTRNPLIESTDIVVFLFSGRMMDFASFVRSPKNDENLLVNFKGRLYLIDVPAGNRGIIGVSTILNLYTLANCVQCNVIILSTRSQRSV